MSINILLVGGTFDKKEGKQSGVINKISQRISYNNQYTLKTINGGNIETLKGLLETTPKYHFIFWFANVDNQEEKWRNVKEYAPHSLLIASKRNDLVGERKKYDFEELIQRVLSVKANLCFEFCKTGRVLFNIKIFDPLGCVWYDGTNIDLAVDKCLERLNYLYSVTRKPSLNGSVPAVAFNDRDKEFLQYVRTSADTFHALMCLPPDVKRFVGNASLRFKEPTRCMNGFPAIRKENIILVSRRNVDKTGITEKDFVPCRLDENDNLIYAGEHKPSVDAPVQLRLFKKLNNIDYILHGHCYIPDAPYTSMAVPCGAIEEVGEILKTINNNYHSLEQPFYTVNLRGHGCLIMASADELKKMSKITFCARPLPEYMEKQEK